MAEQDQVWAQHILLAKAKRFIEKAHGVERESWLYPFWSALALEALARAAVASVSPVLLADASGRDGHHLMYALGLTPQASNYVPRSIPTAHVFSRCEELCDKFTKDHTKFCDGMAGRRNEELHTGGTPFADLPVKAWLPRYYQTAAVLLEFMGEELDDVFGADADAAREMVAALEDEAAKSVNKTVKAHRTVWEARSEEERELAVAEAKKAARRSIGHVIDCPACDSSSLLFGEEVGTPTVELEDELLVERQVMLPTRLRCEACGLEVDSHSKLNAIGHGGTFTRTNWYDPIDYYAAGLESLMEPDFNE